MEISLEVLFKIVRLLPELDSLKIASISMENIEDLDRIEDLAIRSDKITKICSEEIHAYLLLYFPFLFRSMVYLKTSAIDQSLLKIIVRYLLKPLHRYNEKFRLLSFSIAALDDEILQSFGEMIERRRLVHRLHLKRRFDRLFLSWM